MRIVEWILCVWRSKWIAQLSIHILRSSLPIYYFAWHGIYIYIYIRCSTPAIALFLYFSALLRFATGPMSWFFFGRFGFASARSKYLTQLETGRRRPIVTRIQHLKFNSAKPHNLAVIGVVTNLPLSGAPVVILRQHRAPSMHRTIFPANKLTQSLRVGLLIPNIILCVRERDWGSALTMRSLCALAKQHIRQRKLWTR